MNQTFLYESMDEISEKMKNKIKLQMDQTKNQLLKVFNNVD